MVVVKWGRGLLHLLLHDARHLAVRRYGGRGERPVGGARRRSRQPGGPRDRATVDRARAAEARLRAGAADRVRREIETALPRAQGLSGLALSACLVFVAGDERNDRDGRDHEDHQREHREDEGDAATRRDDRTGSAQLRRKESPSQPSSVIGEARAARMTRTGGLEPSASLRAKGNVPSLPRCPA